MKLLTFIRHFTFGTVIIVCVCMWECVCVCLFLCVHTQTVMFPWPKINVGNFCLLFFALFFLGRVSDQSQDLQISQAGWSARLRDPSSLLLVLDHTSSLPHSVSYNLNSNSHAFKASALPSESSTQPMLNLVIVLLASLLLLPDL